MLTIDVDRASDWIERHRDTPFFLYLHVFDPHSPYEPRRPYATMFADQSKREEHIKQREALRKVIANPFFKGRGMATQGHRPWPRSRRWAPRPSAPLRWLRRWR